MFRTNEQCIEATAYIHYSHNVGEGRPSRGDVLSLIDKAEVMWGFALTDAEKEYVINRVNGYGLWT